ERKITAAMFMPAPDATSFTLASAFSPAPAAGDKFEVVYPSTASRYETTYSVVLTSQPKFDVKIDVTPLATTTYNSALALSPTKGQNTAIQLHVVGSSHLVFTPDNWNTPQIVTIRSEENDFVEGGDAKSFADQPSKVNGIRGPLTIVGGAGSSASA